MAFQNAATIVVAQVFQLIDPSGVIVANLTTGNDPTAFPLQALYAGLEMLHNDPNTSDSSLRWTTAGGVANGNEYVQLLGPVNSGGGPEGPRVYLQRNSALPSVQAKIASGNTPGVAATLNEVAAFNSGANYSTRMQTNVDALSLSTAVGMTIASDRVGVVTSGTSTNTPRGGLFGLTTYYTVLGVNTAVGIGGIPANIITIVVNGQPIAGGVLLVWATCSITGVNVTTWSLTVNGAVQTATFNTVTANEPGAALWIVPLAVVGAFNVSLRALAGAANNAQALNTTLGILQLS